MRTPCMLPRAPVIVLGAAQHEYAMGGPASVAFPSLEVLAAAGSAAEGVGTSGGGEVRRHCAV